MLVRPFTLFEEIIKIFKANNSDMINDIKESKQKVMEGDMESPKVALSLAYLEDILIILEANFFHSRMTMNQD